MRTLILLLTSLTLTACTHTLYQSEFTARDDQGKDRSYRFYWTKTSPMLGSDTAGPGKLQMECRTTKEFTESGENSPIILELPDSKFNPLQGQSGTSLVCGSITNLNMFRDYQQGPLQMDISCKPKPAGDFDAVSESLPAAQTYTLVIEEKTRKRSFLKNPEIEPGPMECQPP